MMIPASKFMKEVKDESNWANDILGLCRTYNLQKMSVKDWKSFVKNAVLREVSLQLQVECALNKKTCHIMYQSFKTRKYLFRYLLIWQGKN